MYKHVKRFFDVTFSLIGIIVLLPLFVVVAIWVLLDSRGPVFFKQPRWGKDRTTFNCYKFRTMRLEAPSNVATRDLRKAGNFITISGKVLRRTGIDELPQLLNVLKGDMSLIGPRPVVLSEVDLIDERDKYGANAFLPGIGGWAQSNGRDEVHMQDKARLDGEYAQNFGIAMDISCIWRTFVAIFTSKGFKEGHFGDTEFKHRVGERTKKRPASRLVKFGKRIVNKGNASS